MSAKKNKQVNKCHQEGLQLEQNILDFCELCPTAIQCNSVRKNYWRDRVRAGITSERQSKAKLLMCSTPRCQQMAHGFCLQIHGKELDELQDREWAPSLCRAQPSSRGSYLSPGCKNGRRKPAGEIRPQVAEQWQDWQARMLKSWSNFCKGSTGHEILPKVPDNPLWHTDLMDPSSSL